MIKADLHIHSNYSDGSDSIEDLIKNIISKNIKIFALTDHDTNFGCNEIEKALPEGIQFIPSIELTCIAGGIKCHILGYNCDYNNKTLLSLIEKGKKLRQNKLETRINYLKEKWNIQLNQEELNWLYTRKSVVKTHLANILVKRGLATDNLSAMAKFLDGCKAGDTRFEIEEALFAIKDSGGIAIWAHPLGGEGEIHLTKEEFLPKLDTMVKFGIEGLECYYSRYSEKEIKFLLECVSKNNLLISGGSDYHGKNKDIPLGKLNDTNSPTEASKLTILSAINIIH